MLAISSEERSCGRASRTSKVLVEHVSRCFGTVRRLQSASGTSDTIDGVHFYTQLSDREVDERWVGGSIIRLAPVLDAALAACLNLA
jgi:hypothetical protein